MCGFSSVHHSGAHDSPQSNRGVDIGKYTQPARQHLSRPPVAGVATRPRRLIVSRVIADVDTSGGSRLGMKAQYPLGALKTRSAFSLVDSATCTLRYFDSVSGRLKVLLGAKVYQYELGWGAIWSGGMPLGAEYVAAAQWP